jgi:hypothetical protein
MLGAGVVAAVTIGCLPGTDDMIRVNRGGRDRVTCGRGREIVYADRRDRVARDCERVTRLP